MSRFIPDLWVLFGLLLYLNSLFLPNGSEQSRNVLLMQAAGVFFFILGLVLGWVGKHLHPRSVSPYLNSLISLFFYWTVVFYISFVSTFLLVNTFCYFSYHQIFMDQKFIGMVILITFIILLTGVGVGSLGVHQKIHHREIEENRRKGWEDFNKAPKWMRSLFIPEVVLFTISARSFMNVIFKSNLDWEVRKTDGIEWFSIFLFPIGLSLVFKLFKIRNFRHTFQTYHLDFAWVTLLILFASYKLVRYGIFLRSVMLPVLILIGVFIILMGVSKMKDWLKRNRNVHPRS